MTEDKKIVEVTVTNDNGEQIPVGIMNAKQAMSLPEEMDVSISHRDRAAGSSDNLIVRDELRALTEPWIEPMGIRFPTPIGEEPADRSVEVKALALHMLEEIIASAHEAGWATREITCALIEAARSLRGTNNDDPDLLDASSSIAVREQIGHGEQFD